MADVLRLYKKGSCRQSSKKAVVTRLVAVAGNQPLKLLGAPHVAEVVDTIRNGGYTPNTTYIYLAELRQCLLWLWSEHHAKKLDDEVPHTAALHPRNVVAHRQEIDAILRVCDKPMRLFVLLCSDLAIRSGTAVQIAPPMYDPVSQTLRFRSKKNSAVTLPVTHELAELFAECRLDTARPFITQMCWKYRARKPIHEIMHPVPFDKAFANLRKKAGIQRRITPHDMRRRAAVELYRHTRNVRKVQALLGHSSLASTIWYLDNEIEPLDAQMLEAIKRPFLVRKEQIA